jgi:dTDP-4-dehydrorhamnose 3,5-epimerase
MKYTELRLKGAYVIDLDRLEDTRGFFARTWDEKEFSEHNLESRFVQCNVSHNIRRGTVRGMHYQRAPHAEVKLVRCTSGSILDVIVDIRPGSSTEQEWIGVELSRANRRMMYVPHGFAHGYQTLEDDSEVTYQVSEFYHPESEGRLLWNDPAVGIEWPIKDVVISDKDRTAPPLPARA